MREIVHIIDVQSGNLQSLINAIKRVGDYEVRFLQNASQFEAENDEIKKLIFPGVGNYGHFVSQLVSTGLDVHIKKYVEENRKIMGICVGLQAFFTGSEEGLDAHGLGLLDFQLTRFQISEPNFITMKPKKSVPHIGWNKIEKLFEGTKELGQSESIFDINTLNKYYFVHSYAAIMKTSEDWAKFKSAQEQGWSFCLSKYGSETFLASISYKGLFATQFHPEKSGIAGLKVLKAFLTGQKVVSLTNTSFEHYPSDLRVSETGLSCRIIACLDVRTNDEGDLVVTKGDQYNVRESSDSGTGLVRNLGKPVELATRYFTQGADEITFLNITSFRDSPIRDLPMLEVLKKAAENIFVPLTVGGGIKDLIDPVSGEIFPASKVADLYFRSGADKVSIGSEAVSIAEKFYANGKVKDGKSAIETISSRFGNQAVVISVDPKRVFVEYPSSTSMSTIEIDDPLKYGPNGERYCYYQVTSQGGRQVHELGALELCIACEELGAGEILLNSIDYDGLNNGFNLELLNYIKQAVSIPVIASSGAGKPQHFEEVFNMDCGIDAALGAGMFHRGDYTVNDVKFYLQQKAKLDVRLDDDIKI